MKIQLLALIFAVNIVPQLISAQTPGNLDNTFDGDGKLITTIGTGTSIARAVAIQADGKIIFTGSSNNGANNDFGIIRVLPDGTPDNTFGNNGKVMSDFNGDDDFATAIAVEPLTGRIVVGGYTFTGNGFDFSVACYHADGSPDNSFGNNGKVITSVGTTSFCKAMAIQPDGKIVLGGYAFNGNQNRFVLVRYNTNGSLDLTFNGTGTSFAAFAGNSATATSLTIQPGDGKLVLAGQMANSVTFRWEFAVARFNMDGTLDNTFDTDGKVTTSIGTSDNYVNAIGLQPDGKIVLAGHCGTTPSNNNFTLARYNDNGSLDAGFGTAGIVINGFASGTDNQVKAVALQPDGKIIAAGSLLIGNADQFALARFTAAGLPDNTFGTNGKVSTQLGLNDGVEAIALQPDGKLVAAGLSFTGTQFDMALARYENGLLTGLNEIKYMNNVTSVYPNPTRKYTILTYELANPKTVSIGLYNSQGEFVTSLKKASTQTKGKHEELLYFPEELSASSYSVVLNSEGEQQSVQVILVK